MEKDIRKIRLGLGLTMEEFGNKFDPPASKSIVSKWERGVSEPSPKRMKKFQQIRTEVTKNSLKNFTDIELIDELKRRAIERS